MIHYLVRRAFGVLGVLFVVSVVVFLLLRVLPGDVVVAMAATSDAPGRASNEALEAVRQRLGIDKPLYQQYLSWVTGILMHGDFGRSLATQESINVLFATRLPATLLLMAYSMTFAVLLGLPLGIMSALKRNTMLDIFARIVALTGLSIPSFWLGILILVFLAYLWGWSPPLIYSELTQDPGEHFLKMLWPSLVAGGALAAAIARMTRSTVLETLTQDYVRTARSKGLLNRVVILRHVLRNALIPVLSIMGVQVAALVGGVVVLEKVFGVPGLGTLLIDAVLKRDYTVVQSAILIATVAVVLVNFLVDVLYAQIDPRIRRV